MTIAPSTGGSSHSPATGSIETTPAECHPGAGSRHSELHEAATLLHLAARNAADEAYYRGYVSGAARRIAGGIGADELEAVAFELLQDSPGGLVQLLGRGYRDGVAGKAIAAA